MHAIMMMEIAVAHLLINGSAWNANVCVSQNFYGMETFPSLSFVTILLFCILDFTCSVDADCNNGYCENKKCFCLDGYQYSKDCSVFGRKYLRLRLNST